MPAYFTLAHFTALTADPGNQMPSPEREDARQRLREVHDRIYPPLRTQNVDLHQWTKTVVTEYSVGAVERGGTLVVQYLRDSAQARVVERLMGREEAAASGDLAVRRHPVIEMRLTPRAFVLELIISPDARWDQQNLAGKLTISRHKQSLFSMLRQLDNTYALGFWRGIHRSDMHLTGQHLQHPQILDEWLSTFEPGQDWFRLGTWFAPDDPLLYTDDLSEAVSQHVKTLYTIYQHILWTSDNNFHDFFRRR